MKTITKPNPDSRPPAPIPVYTLPDVMLHAAAADFAVQRLEMTFANIHRNVHAHRHDHYQLWWITGGRGSVTVDTVEYAIAPSMLYYLLPGQMHAARFSGPLSGYSIRFTRAFFLYDAHDQANLAELPLFYPPDTVPLIRTTRRQAATVNDLLHKIEQEYQMDLANRATVLRAYLHILLVEAKRLRQHVTTTHSSEASYLLTKRFLLLVEAHYRSGTSVPDYAAQLHVTAAHLNQTVRRTLNKTAQAVIQERVLLEAQRRLRYSDLSVAEIAQQLNFRDASYFGRFFKQHTGCSPHAFRQVP
jgi:AraC family transcriptional regulator, transcriptional activator of pobA